MPQTIARDSTIQTVWSHLTNLREYVANVRHRMDTCLKAHGSAFVKIGVTGTGQKPCYRIFYYDENTDERIYVSNWYTHQPLPIEDAQNENWSERWMSFEQIDALLKEKTGWQER